MKWESINKLLILLSRNKLAIYPSCGRAFWCLKKKYVSRKEITIDAEERIPSMTYDSRAINFPPINAAKPNPSWNVISSHADVAIRERFVATEMA